MGEGPKGADVKKRTFDKMKQSQQNYSGTQKDTGFKKRENKSSEKKSKSDRFNGGGRDQPA